MNVHYSRSSHHSPQTAAKTAARVWVVTACTADCEKFAYDFPLDSTIHGVPTTAPRPPQKQRLESAKVRRPLSAGVGGNSLYG